MERPDSLLPLARSSLRPPLREDVARFSALIATGWLLTNLGLAIADLPLRFLLKDDLGLAPERVAAFLALGQFTNYVKPVAGLLTDSVPLFGTRRRHYLLLSLLGTGLFWLLLSVVPRSWTWMLVTYTVLYSTVVVTSTTLGGVMVEAGNRFGVAGRITAQRIATFKIASLLGGPIGGFLSSLPFAIPAAICAGMHLVLVPLFGATLPEAKTAKASSQAWRDARGQLRQLAHSHTLLCAAGMVFLIAVAPGFHTPLLYYQTDQLHFTKQFVGNLVLVSSVTGLLGAMIYYALCRRVTLGVLTGTSIALHALGSLTYFFYRDPGTAIVVTAINGITTALAMLPVYDLAARATPKGSEALGYALMMSVWNFTNAASDYTGSLLFSHFARDFPTLVWINAATTALALLAVPFLPRALLAGRDGDPRENEEGLDARSKPD